MRARGGASGSVMRRGWRLAAVAAGFGLVACHGRAGTVQGEATVQTPEPPASPTHAKPVQPSAKEPPAGPPPGVSVSAARKPIPQTADHVAKCGVAWELSGLPAVSRDGTRVVVASGLDLRELDRARPDERWVGDTVSLRFTDVASGTQAAQAELGGPEIVQAHTAASGAVDCGTLRAAMHERASALTEQLTREGYRALEPLPVFTEETERDVEARVRLLSLPVQARPLALTWRAGSVLAGVLGEPPLATLAHPDWGPSVQGCGEPLLWAWSDRRSGASVVTAEYRPLTERLDGCWTTRTFVASLPDSVLAAADRTTLQETLDAAAALPESSLVRLRPEVVRPHVVFADASLATDFDGPDSMTCPAATMVARHFPAVDASGRIVSVAVDGPRQSSIGDGTRAAHAIVPFEYDATDEGEYAPVARQIAGITIGAPAMLKRLTRGGAMDCKAFREGLARDALRINAKTSGREWFRLHRLPISRLEMEMAVDDLAERSVVLHFARGKLRAEIVGLGVIAERPVALVTSADPDCSDTPRVERAVGDPHTGVVQVQYGFDDANAANSCPDSAVVQVELPPEFFDALRLAPAELGVRGSVETWTPSP